MEAPASLPRRLSAEALGTAFLLAAVVGSGIMAQRLSEGNGALALLCNTLPTGAILTVLILIFGAVSGAHFNPAVSVAFALRRELPWPEAASYTAAQIIGGVIGVWTAHLMFELPVWQVSLHARTGPGQWLAEFVATFGLLLTILGCVARTPAAVPYAVGLYITSAYWFTSSTSFANPAVTIARCAIRHLRRHRSYRCRGVHCRTVRWDACGSCSWPLALAIMNVQNPVCVVLILQRCDGRARRAPRCRIYMALCPMSMRPSRMLSRWGAAARRFAYRSLQIAEFRMTVATIGD